VRIHNFPGFGDLREYVREEIEGQLRNCNLAVYVIDSSRIVLQEEIERFARATSLAPGRIVVFNFCDKLDEDECDQVIAENKRRLGVHDPVLSCLKPKARGRNPYFESGVRELRQRINKWSTEERQKAPIFLEEDTGAPTRFRL
jgi:GTP-binding protein EngB required for normal cell division